MWILNFLLSMQVGGRGLNLTYSLLPDRFVLVSYNILADKNASHHRDLYWNIPFDVMKWDSRKGLIFQEICRWNADIVCLQASMLLIILHLLMLSLWCWTQWIGSFKIKLIIFFCCYWIASFLVFQEVDRYMDILMNMKKKGYAGSYKVNTSCSLMV